MPGHDRISDPLDDEQRVASIRSWSFPPANCLLIFLGQEFFFKSFASSLTSPADTRQQNQIHIDHGNEIRT
jgi:hypothetical protein